MQIYPIPSIQNYTTSWNSVIHPAGNSVVKRVQQSVTALFANIAKTFANVVISSANTLSAVLNLPNKAYRFIFPMQQQAAPVQQEIEQDILDEDAIAYVQQLQEPVITQDTSSSYETGVKVAGVAALALLVIASVHYRVDQPILTFGKNVIEATKTFASKVFS